MNALLINSPACVGESEETKPWMLANYMSPATAVPDQASVAQATAASQSSHGPARLLIVEDQTDLAMLLEVFLIAEGYQVNCVSTARRAYEVLEREKFDMLLLDVDLPDGNGFDICRSIRQPGPQAGVPVCFCTGRDPVETREVAEKLNAKVLLKPYIMEDLIAEVRAGLKSAG